MVQARTACQTGLRGFLASFRPPTPDTCAALTAAGVGGRPLLKPLPCYAQNNDVPYLIQSVRNCNYCDASGVCYRRQLWADWLGYRCVPISEAGRTITFVYAFQPSQLNPLSGWPSEAESNRVRCGGINATVPRTVSAAPLRLVQGDVLRVCGDAIRGSVVPNFISALGGQEPIGSLQSAVCAGVANCLDFRFRSAYLARKEATVAASAGFLCAVMKSPPGAVRCWGNGGSDNVPSGLGSVIALSASAKSVSMCSRSTGTGSARCWGDKSYDIDLAASSLGSHDEYKWTSHGVTGRIRVYGPDKHPVFNDVTRQAFTAIPRMLSSSGTSDYLCLSADFDIDAWSSVDVTCLGRPQFQRRIALPERVRVDMLAASTSFVCGSFIGSGNVSCWGGVAPSSLPPVRRLLQTPQDAICALVEGQASPLCWGPDGQTTALLGPTTWTNNVEEVSLADTYGCYVTRAGTGDRLLTCWGDVPGGPLPVDLSLAEPLGESDGRLIVLMGDRQDSKPFPTGPGDFFYIQSRLLMRVLEVVQRPSTKPDAFAAFIVKREPDWSVPASSVFGTILGDSYPMLRLYIQRSADSQPETVDCTPMTVESAYSIRCDPVAFVYGYEAYQNNYGHYSTLRVQGGPPLLTYASVLTDPSSGHVVDVNITALAATMAGSLGLPRLNASQFLAVRPGSVVEVRGSGFGLHARLQNSVPWWSSGASPIRSCIHLSWWYTNASAYHDETGCICNGQEDWLGEGELPLSAITLWNDTHLAFRAPAMEGVRELRMCVEGQGLNTSTNKARSASSVFLAWEPPALSDLLPARFVDNTNDDAAVTLVLETTAEAQEAERRQWGLCQETLTHSGGRTVFSPPVSASESYKLRYCTSAIVVSSSMQTRPPACVAGTLVHATLASSVCEPVLNATQWLPGSSQVSTFAARRLAVPYVHALPNALLSFTFYLSVWDGGVAVTRAGTERSITFTRSQPILQAVSPNPLLLGPGTSSLAVDAVGDSDAPPDAAVRGAFELLTLYGAGLRTAEEIQDPRNMLSGYSANVSVYIDGVPCGKATVVRVPGRPAVATCIYPSGLLDGGKHVITMCHS